MRRFRRKAMACALLEWGLATSSPAVAADTLSMGASFVRSAALGASQGIASSSSSSPPLSDDERIALMPAMLGAHDPGSGSLHTRVLEMARGVDATQSWSADPQWLAIMGWSVPMETLTTWSASALELAPGRYPEEGGRDDPALDFRASIALAWTQPDFSCRFPLRARFLGQNRLIPVPLTIDEGGCPDFEAFAKPDLIESIDLLYTAQSWGEPGTSAGHVLFKVHEASPNQAYNEDNSRTFSYAVDMAIKENQENLVWRGLVGEAQGELMEGRASLVEERYGTVEQRDIQYYRMDLSRREMRDLLALFWVQKREASHASYYFFSVNCARLTYDAVRTILPDLPHKTSWFIHPHEVLVLLQPHLTPLGVRPSRRRKAVEGEHHREQLAEALEELTGFDALHDQRWATHAERTRAMETFAEAVDLGALSEGEKRALTEYLDAVIDIELFDIDLQQGYLDDNVTSPLLDATIDLRARLPARPGQTLEPLPPVGLEGSGSRRITLRSGVNHQGQPVASVRTGIIDEQPGESFSVSLNRYGRNEFLVTEIALRMDGLDFHVDEIRTVLLSIANYSNYVRTTADWWGSHSGFVFDLTMQSLPSRDIPWGAWLRFGQSLNLIQSHEHLGLLVLGADLSVASWMHDGEYLRAGLGMWLEGSLPFTESGAHRLWVAVRVQPTLVYDAYETEVEVLSRLDFTISRTLGCMLGLYFDLDHGRVLNDQWQAGVLFSL